MVAPRQAGYHDARRWRCLLRGKGGVYRVVLADDEGTFRSWFRALLEASGEFQVVAEASNAAEALRLVELLGPNVVVADVDMPGGDGLEVAQGLRRRWPHVKAVLISGHTERGYEQLAMEAGALAFIPKSDLSLDALRQALQKER